MFRKLGPHSWRLTLCSPQFLGFVKFEFLLAMDAARRPRDALQPFQADRLFAIDAKTVRTVGDGVQRQVYLRQRTRSPAEVRGSLFADMHALHLVDRIVFALVDLDPAGLRMYLAPELPALVLHGFLEVDRLCLCHRKLPV
jgi:hypothetical protein